MHLRNRTDVYAMTKRPPAISVLMPVYEQDPVFLREAVESVLSQSFSDLELIIIDDGSADQSCKRLLREIERRDIRVRLIANSTNLGIIASRNVGIAHARGEYIALLDSDDIAQNDRLQKQYDFLSLHGEYALCGSWAFIIDEHSALVGKKVSPCDHRVIKQNIMIYNFFTHSTCMFRKKIISQIGAYDPAAWKAEDYDFLLRVIAHYPVAILPEFLCSYRINRRGDSLRNNKLQEWRSLLVRIRALKRGDYPISYVLKLFIPIALYLFLPTPVKQLLLRQTWRRQ